MHNPIVDAIAPGLSLTAQTAFRDTYAVFLFVQLAITLPGLRRFFSTERYGGYVESSPWRDRLYHPAAVVSIASLWLLCALGMFFDRSTLASTIVAYAACRYLLINPRWVSLSRGFGAVGTITAWCNFALIFLEASRVIDDHGILRSSALLAFRVDMALIMFVAGFYKITAGYVRNDGFETALVNPWWSFWASSYRRLRPGNSLFFVMNHSAYAVECLSGIAMLTPWHFAGAVAIAASFSMLQGNLRLAYLPGMVVASMALFIDPSTPLDRWLATFIHTGGITAHASSPIIPRLLALFLWFYLATIILTRAGLYYNFYGRRRLPGVLQPLNDALANMFVITIWRVFTANVINFYVDVFTESPDGQRVRYSSYGWRSFRTGLRFAHAGEFVALCTTFTTLRYFPDRPELFHDRLVRYARTVSHTSGTSIVLRFISIIKGDDFQYRPATEFIVNAETGSVREQVLDPALDPRAASASSPIVRSAGPGTYAPAPGKP